MIDLTLHPVSSTLQLHPEFGTKRYVFAARLCVGMAGYRDVNIPIVDLRITALC